MPKKLRLFNKSPIPYADAGLRNLNVLDLGSPMEQYLRAYQKSGTVFGVVSLLASATAFPEWRLYRKTTDNRVRYSTADIGSDQRIEVIQHQALKILNNPNPFMTRMNLFEISQTYLDLTGEAWWILDYAGGLQFPTSLWPVRPDRMVPVPDPQNFLKGYVYQGPDGEQIPFQLNEVIVNKLPNPLDLYRGQGPIQTVMADVDAGDYAAQYNRNFFYNDATPGGIITVPTELTDEEFDQLTNRWRESNRGVSRAHRVAVLESGQQWVSTAASQKDMAFVELVNNSRDKIREAFRVHKVMVGISDDVNRANAQTGEEVHHSTQTVPRLNRWREVLNFQYLPLFGSTGAGVEFDYVKPQVDNREQSVAEMTAKASAAQMYIDAGFDPHDVLEMLGTPDMNVVEKATQAPALPPGWVPGTPAAPEQSGSEDNAT